MNKLYFIIPTINGEINGLPYAFVSKCITDYIKANREVIVYEISLETLDVKELKD